MDTGVGDSSCVSQSSEKIRVTSQIEPSPIPCQLGATERPVSLPLPPTLSPLSTEDCNSPLWSRLWHKVPKSHRCIVRYLLLMVNVTGKDQPGDPQHVFRYLLNVGLEPRRPTNKLPRDKVSDIPHLLALLAVRITEYIDLKWRSEFPRVNQLNSTCWT